MAIKKDVYYFSHDNTPFPFLQYSFWKILVFLQGLGYNLKRFLPPVHTISQMDFRGFFPIFSPALPCA